MERGGPPMKTIIGIGWLAALVLSASVGAAPEDPASVRDLQRLQQELDNLDEEIDALADVDPAAATRLRDRVDLVREDTVALRSKLQRHPDDGAGVAGVTIGEVDRLRRDVRRLRADIDAAREDSS